MKGWILSLHAGDQFLANLSLTSHVEEDEATLLSCCGVRPLQSEVEFGGYNRHGIEDFLGAVNECYHRGAVDMLNH